MTVVIATRYILVLGHEGTNAVQNYLYTPEILHDREYAQEVFRRRYKRSGWRLLKIQKVTIRARVTA
jgi:hypothetical protein